MLTSNQSTVASNFVLLLTPRILHCMKMHSISHKIPDVSPAAPPTTTNLISSSTTHRPSRSLL